jgi:hypothetical protein
MFSTKIQVANGILCFLSSSHVMKRRQPFRTKQRFVNQDKVLIERLIFDLGLRCEAP